MSDNVIQFGRPPAPGEEGGDRVVWRCNCGCLTFFVRADLELECAQCSTTIEDVGSWRERAPAAPAEAVPEIEEGDVTVVDLNSGASAIRRIVKKIDPAKVAAVIVMNVDGLLSTWGGADGAAQRSWIRRRMRAALKLLAC